MNEAKNQIKLSIKMKEWKKYLNIETIYKTKYT